MKKSQPTPPIRTKEDTNAFPFLGPKSKRIIETLARYEPRAMTAFDPVVWDHLERFLRAGGGVALLPEIKSPHLYPGIEEKVLQAIAAADYGEYTIIQSFDPNSLDTLYGLNQDAYLCQLYGQGVLSVKGPQPGHADRVCLMAEMVVLNPWMIRQNHEEGRQVFVWFGIIEHPLVMRFLLALGVDGLIVDDPLALAQILGR